MTAEDSRRDGNSEREKDVSHATQVGNNGGKTKKDANVRMFVCTQNLNEWSQKIPVAQALKIYKFATKPEQPRFSSSISLRSQDKTNMKYKKFIQRFFQETIREEN